jgi:hypothetical protein
VQENPETLRSLSVPAALPVSRRNIDILHVSAGTTRGWRVNDESLRIALTELGVTVERVAIRRPAGGLVHRMRSPANDLYQAACLVAAAEQGLRRVRPRAVIYSSSHAALLQPHRAVPEAVWVDGPIALMRPGARNAPIRALERLRQHRLDLVMSMSLEDPDALVEPLRPRMRAVLHVPIDPSRSEATLPLGVVPPFGVTYAGTPRKKGLDLAIEAWRQASPGMTLVVTGIGPETAARYLGGRLPSGVHFVGPVPRAVHRGIVRRAAVYVSASRREEYGTSQLEALSDLVPLVTLPSQGAAEPVAVVRRLTPTLVARDMSAASLAECIRAAIEMTPDQLSQYRARCAKLMARYSYEAFKQRLARDVLSRLLL